MKEKFLLFVLDLTLLMVLASSCTINPPTTAIATSAPTPTKPVEKSIQLWRTGGVTEEYKWEYAETAWSSWMKSHQPRSYAVLSSPGIKAACAGSEYKFEDASISCMNEEIRRLITCMDTKGFTPRPANVRNLSNQCLEWIYGE